VVVVVWWCGGSVVTVVKKVLWLAQAVFSYFVLHRSKHNPKYKKYVRINFIKTCPENRG